MLEHSDIHEGSRGGLAGKHRIEACPRIPYLDIVANLTGLLFLLHMKFMSGQYKSITLTNGKANNINYAYYNLSIRINLDHANKGSYYLLNHKSIKNTQQ